MCDDDPQFLYRFLNSSFTTRGSLGREGAAAKRHQQRTSCMVSGHQPKLHRLMLHSMHRNIHLWFITASSPGHKARRRCTPPQTCGLLFYVNRTGGVCGVSEWPLSRNRVYMSRKILNFVHTIFSPLRAGRRCAEFHWCEHTTGLCLGTW